MDYQSNTTLAAIAAALKAAEKVLVTTHAKPDGDALGAVVALARALELQGKHVERWIMPPLTEALRVLTSTDPIHLHEKEGDALPRIEPDRIVVVDTGAWTQLEPMRPWIEPRREKTIVIDHHLRGDDVGAMRYVDTGAAAACQIVAQLIDVIGTPFDALMADALYVGIASDTGWFRFSNTTPETHELAARLLRLGVDHGALYARLEQSERPSKLMLMRRALDSVELIAGGRVAIMSLRTADFEQTGARMEETERLVDLPQVVGEVQVVVLLTEMNGGGKTRCSFRSKPGAHAVDVNELARQFGGGGHARAAGAKFDTGLDEARRRLTGALESAMATRGI
jgi:phosphoesterase RecJ-like protein